MKTPLLFISLFFSYNLLAQDCCKQFNGTWQPNGQSTFEKWEQVNDTLWTGESFKINEGERKVIETLRLIKTNASIIYEATVLDQNDGSSISFVLNTQVKNLLSFENLEHDFPKKIQYQFLSENKIAIQVLGENDEGFSLEVSKVE